MSFISIIGLLAIGAGIDLMTFLKNGSSETQMHFIKVASMIIYLAGFIYTRILYAVKTFLAMLANKGEEYTVKLLRYKFITRVITTLIGIVHISLVATHDYTHVATYTYIFIPIYIIVEAIGNF